MSLTNPSAGTIVQSLAYWEAYSDALRERQSVCGATIDDPWPDGVAGLDMQNPSGDWVDQFIRHHQTAIYNLVEEVDPGVDKWVIMHDADGTARDDDYYDHVTDLDQVETYTWATLAPRIAAISGYDCEDAGVNPGFWRRGGTADTADTGPHISGSGWWLPVFKQLWAAYQLLIVTLLWKAPYGTFTPDEDRFGTDTGDSSDPWSDRKTNAVAMYNTDPPTPQGNIGAFTSLYDSGSVREAQIGRGDVGLTPDLPTGRLVDPSKVAYYMRAIGDGTSDWVMDDQGDDDVMTDGEIRLQAEVASSPWMHTIGSDPDSNAPPNWPSPEPGSGDTIKLGWIAEDMFALGFWPVTK